MIRTKHNCSTLFLAVLAIFIVFQSCDTEPIVVDKDVAEIPVVLSLICPEEKGTEAYIGRSFPEVGIASLGDAIVEIAGGGLNKKLTYHSNGTYRTENFQVQHNLTYQISVLLNSGKRLLGATKVPGKITIANISTGDTLFYRQEPAISKYTYYAIGPRISWHGGDRAAMFICYYQFEENIMGQPAPIIATADTSTATFRLMFYNNAPGIDTKLVPTRKAKLFVCAIDSCFYKNGGYTYQEGRPQVGLTNGDDLKIKLPIRNLTGWTNIANGTGVFGSYTYDAVDVVVALQQEQMKIAKTFPK